jgi:hypothetical protein
MIPQTARFNNGMKVCNVIIEVHNKKHPLQSNGIRIFGPLIGDSSFHVNPPIEPSSRSPQPPFIRDPGRTGKAKHKTNTLLHVCSFVLWYLDLVSNVFVVNGCLCSLLKKSTSSVTLTPT